MAKPRLPKHATDAWDSGFLLDPAQPVQAINGRGGLVVAGGEQMFMLRPGAQNYAYRDPPDPGLIEVIAAEARPPWRYAIGAGELVTLFYKRKDEDAIVRLRATETEAVATHLAWAKDGDASALYIRWDDGVVVRTNQDMSGVDVLEMDWIDAVGSDAAGAIAFVTFDGVKCRVYRSKDGTQMRFDDYDFESEPDGHMRVAVAGEAVAITLDGGGVFVSRALGAPLVRCEALESGGPIEFEGTSSDAALFGVITGATVSAIVRVDKAGVATRVAEFESSSELVPEISDLSWDATRRTLWAASPHMGIISCTAPSAKGGKKPLAS
jgi:hypothetical protein